MKRLMEKTVLVGLVTAWRLATVPTRRSPDWVKATTDRVVRPPSAFSMTAGSPPSRTAIHELVVPRSIPMVLAILGGSSASGTEQNLRQVRWDISAGGLRVQRQLRWVGKRVPSGLAHEC